MTKKPLLKWMAQHNISQLDLQRMTGISQQCISDHLRNDTPFSCKNVVRLMKVSHNELDPISLRPELAEVLKRCL